MNYAAHRTRIPGMLRLVPVLLAIAYPSLARAETCTSSPRDPSTRAMQLELASDDSGFAGRRFAVARGTEFPAISKDGSLIAYLFFDAADFSGAPITTFVVWSRTGKRVVSLQLDSPLEQKFDTVERDRRERKALRDANARLAATRWRPLAVHQVCSADLTTLHLDDVTVTYDADTRRLALEIDGKRSRRLDATFRAPGVRSEREGGGGPCGHIQGLANGFGSKAIGVLFLLASADVGGDSCFGLPPADRMIAVPL
jgi:hypothetical protein